MRMAFKKLTLLSAIAVAMSSAILAHGQEIGVRVVNGKPSAEGAWPWMVALLNSEDPEDTSAHFCGGSLIGPRHILTAAHCVSGSSPELIQVLIGARELRFEKGDRHDIIGIRVHKQYNAATTTNDLAILELANPVSNQPINLALKADAALYQSGQDATIIGWGMTSADRPILPTILQEAKIPIQSDAVCLNDMGRLFNSKSMLCAGIKATTDSSGDGVGGCYGDSGGPLMVPDGNNQWKQVGVVSWGFGCADSKSWSVFSDLPANETFLAGDVTPPTGKVLSLRCKGESCSMRAFAEDADSEIAHVQMVVERRYKGRCKDGKSCSKVKTQVVTAKKVDTKEVWESQFSLANLSNSKNKFTLSIKDAAGNIYKVAVSPTIK